jgi:hypothetical protein
MTYFRKIFFRPLLQDDEIFGWNSSKGMGGEKKVSMLVQDSLPIYITIAK